MKIQGHLIMRNSKGAIGCTPFEFEANWSALDIRDSDKMENFMPLKLGEIFITTDNWMFRLPITDKEGFGMVTCWKEPA